MGKRMNINQLLGQSVCRIIKEGKTVATAFAVNEKNLLSAGHCFRDYTIGNCFEASFINSRVKVELVVCSYEKENGVDYAVLQIYKSDSKFKPLELTFCKEQSGDFQTIGYGETLQGFSPAEGKILGNYYIDNNQHNYLFKLDSKQIGQIGFSGSPIFSKNSNSVVAIQCETTNIETGAERDTSLAFPLIRLLETSAEKYVIMKTTINTTDLIENYLLPSFGKSILCLEHSDNLGSYMRCIVVKLLYNIGKRCTVFVAEGGRNKDSILPVIRGKHKKTRRLTYGIVGGMIKANVPIIYDFENNKCYSLGLGGTSSEYTDFTDKSKGAKEGRIALLVAPIRNEQKEIVGVLSFDFFPVTDPKKNINRIMSNNPNEIGRILYSAEMYANTLSQLLTKTYKEDNKFLIS